MFVYVFVCFCFVFFQLQNLLLFLYHTITTTTTTTTTTTILPPPSPSPPHLKLTSLRQYLTKLGEHPVLYNSNDVLSTLCSQTHCGDKCCSCSNSGMAALGLCSAQLPKEQAAGDTGCLALARSLPLQCLLFCWWLTYSSVFAGRSALE